MTTISGLRSGQVAEAAGVNLQTLRYYERRGILTEPQRTLGGHRIYTHETVTILRVIKAAQRLGFTLEEVSDLLEAGKHQHGTRPDTGLQARAREKLTEVEQKIADLHTIRATLQPPWPSVAMTSSPAPTARTAQYRSPTSPKNTMQHITDPARRRSWLPASVTGLTWWRQTHRPHTIDHNCECSESTTLLPATKR